MTDKSEIKLSHEEMDIVCDVQKKAMELIAENIPSKLDPEKTFHIATISFCFIISNFLNSYGINKPEEYMKDLSNLIAELHDKIRENGSYMVYKDNKKIDEGKFN